MAMKRLTPEGGHDQTETTGQPPRSVQRLTEPEINLGVRPEVVQIAVDEAFEANKTAKSWGLYDGQAYWYGLLGLEDELILKNLATKNQKKKDIYVLDVGCARGGWGQRAMEIFLKDEVCQKSGKHFHIFSVTGGQECEEKIESKVNVTLHQLNQFKIENIDEEFERRGFDLKNRFDLIVSSWTLRHLVDPWGTLKRMYRLLTPAQGILISNGFLFAFDDSEEIQGFPSHTWNILAQANAVSLFRYWDSGHDAGQFLLMKTNTQELAIPIEYTGKTIKLTWEYQCSSKIATVFKKGPLQTAEPFWFKPIRKTEDHSEEDGILRDDDDPIRRCYCHPDNQQSKDLYALLKSLELLSRPSLGK
jgi:2-polyprenyl-3-methyl-5-hydroxy-6-metoxy-1,4-benzoquinol methylase